MREHANTRVVEKIDGVWARVRSEAEASHPADAGRALTVFDRRRPRVASRSAVRTFEPWPIPPRDPKPAA